MEFDLLKNSLSNMLCVPGISELSFNLSTNSTVLNQWTSTTLALSGLLPKSDILHAIVSPSAAHSPRVG